MVGKCDGGGTIAKTGLVMVGKRKGEGAMAKIGLVMAGKPKGGREHGQSRTSDGR